MKRYDDSAYWYLLTAAPDQGGKVTRFYVVECRKCGDRKSHHATSVSDPQLRKIFMRGGWEIGKFRNGHLCPKCQIKVRPAPAPVPPRFAPVMNWQAAPPPAPVVTPSLADAWQAAGDDERRKFLERFSQSIIAAAATLRPKTLPTKPELVVVVPRPETPPAPAPEPPPPEPELVDDDAPADWWIELEKRTAGR
jgi:hypothetical protein